MQVNKICNNLSGELRIPSRLLSSALSTKRVKDLRLFAASKLEGHRSHIRCLCESLKIHPRTCKRQIAWIVGVGWAGSDGAFLFPRSWHKLKFSKRGGLYLSKAPRDLKRFEALCFSKALKKILRRKRNKKTNRGKGGLHSTTGRVLQTDFPARFLSKSLGLSERRFERLKALARRYRYISVKPQVTIIGKAADYPMIKKHLHGVPVFKRGKFTVVPDVSRIRVLV